MAPVPYTASEWCGIGARLWDLVRQDGDTQVQMTFINGSQMSDETLIVAASSTDLCLISESTAKPWQDVTLTGHVANLRAPQIPNFEAQVLLPAMGAARKLGVQQGLITAERERLNADHANAIADVQNRNAQLNWQVEEAHNNPSVRESNIAGASNQVRELQQQLEATRAQLQERKFHLGELSAQLQDCESHLTTRDAYQAARNAKTAGRGPRHSERSGRWTCHASKHRQGWRSYTIASNASLDGWGHAYKCAPTKPDGSETAGYSPDFSRQCWETAFSTLDAFNFSHLSIGKHFWSRRRETSIQCI
ncbi:hypothetical protein TcYC6_0062690 [Trypanosoma cruzi]|nr:hypothetical protein TcYC6_0062690 [Trypanosoma cruzi]